MVGYDYVAALQAAREEFAQLAKQRDAISIRMLQLEKTIQGLATLAGQTQIAQGSFQMELSDAIVIALQNAAQPMSPVGIRDMLVAMGVQFARFVNPMSAIHNALKRLKHKRLIIEYEGGMWGISP
jgi:hypothetical protein